MKTRRIKKEVVLQRPSDPSSRIGLVLCYEGDHCDTVIFVGELEEGSVAARSGQIKAGDQILKVNGVSVRGRRDVLLQFSKCTGNEIRILVARRVRKTFKRSSRLAARTNISSSSSSSTKSVRDMSRRCHKGSSNNTDDDSLISDLEQLDEQHNNSLMNGNITSKFMIIENRNALGEVPKSAFKVPKNNNAVNEGSSSSSLSTVDMQQIDRELKMLRLATGSILNECQKVLAEGSPKRKEEISLISRLLSASPLSFTEKLAQNQKKDMLPSTSMEEALRARGALEWQQLRNKNLHNGDDEKSMNSHNSNTSNNEYRKQITKPSSSIIHSPTLQLQKMLIRELSKQPTNCSEMGTNNINKKQQEELTSSGVESESPKCTANVAEEAMPSTASATTCLLQKSCQEGIADINNRNEGTFDASKRCGKLQRQFACSESIDSAMASPGSSINTVMASPEDPSANQQTQKSFFHFSVLPSSTSALNPSNDQQTLVLPEGSNETNLKEPVKHSSQPRTALKQQKRNDESFEGKTQMGAEKSALKTKPRSVTTKQTVRFKIDVNDEWMPTQQMLLKNLMMDDDADAHYFALLQNQQLRGPGYYHHSDTLSPPSNSGDDRGYCSLRELYSSTGTHCKKEVPSVAPFLIHQLLPIVDKKLKKGAGENETSKKSDGINNGGTPTSPRRKIPDKTATTTKMASASPNATNASSHGLPPIPPQPNSRIRNSTIKTKKANDGKEEPLLRSIV